MINPFWPVKLIYFPSVELWYACLICPNAKMLLSELSGSAAAISPPVLTTPLPTTVLPTLIPKQLGLNQVSFPINTPSVLPIPEDASPISIAGVVDAFPNGFNIIPD